MYYILNKYKHPQKRPEDRVKYAVCRDQSHVKINKDVLGLLREQTDVSVQMDRPGSADLLRPPFSCTYETSAENNFLLEQTSLPSSFFHSHKVFEWERNKFAPIEHNICSPLTRA